MEVWVRVLLLCDGTPVNSFDKPTECSLAPTDGLIGSGPH